MKNREFRIIYTDAITGDVVQQSKTYSGWFADSRAAHGSHLLRMGWDSCQTGESDYEYREGKSVKFRATFKDA